MNEVRLARLEHRAREVKMASKEHEDRLADLVLLVARASKVREDPTDNRARRASVVRRAREVC